MLRRATMRPISGLLFRTSSISRVACTAACSGRRLASNNPCQPLERASRLRTPSSVKPVGTFLQRYASTNETPNKQLHKEEEKRYGQDTLQSDPAAVSIDSSVRSVFEEAGEGSQEEDTDMLAGIRSDLKTIKDTFALTEVPKEAYYIGLAGVLPYLATSLSTFYLAWDINHAHEFGQGVFLSGQTAELLLHIIEPIQIGYGAVIISFLGAINWGLEFAGYGGYQKYRRYAIGVVAPAVAWPTMLMPVEYALITQFLSFTFLYFFDARSTTQGWFPTWYGTYRFVLTFVVGASIVVSLIGRGKIADKVGKLPGPADHIKAIRDSQMESLEQEEKELRSRMMAQDEAEED